MLATILKEQRTKMGLTQQEVADHLHVTRQAISGWETGKSYPDIPLLVALSDYYDLSLDYMLKGDEKYLAKIEEDTKELSFLKKGQKAFFGLLILLPLFLLLGVTIKDQDTLLWRLLFYTMVGCTLFFMGYVAWLLKKADRFDPLFWGFLTIAVVVNILQNFLTIPYAGVIVWEANVLVLICLVARHTRRKNFFK